MGYKNVVVFPIYVSDQRFEDSVDLLLLIDTTCTCFTWFIFHKTKNKNKKWFCKSCLQCFSSEYVLIEHKEDCFSINGVQSVKIQKGRIDFQNYFKPVSSKIYADFVCNLTNTEVYEGSYTKKYHDHVPSSFAYKVVFIYDRFSKRIVFYRGEYTLKEYTLKEYTQPAHDVPGTSPEGPQKVLTSGTYRGPSGNPQGTKIKTDNLMKKLFFRSNSSCNT